ncbi:MAG: sulfotransferase [Bacteroidota bacterium]
MPIFIASPIQRCGTTLLQRLLSSAPSTLIFGETVANDIHLLASLYQNKQLMLNGPHNAWRQQQLQAVLNGQVNAWIPDLLPDTSKYMANFKGLLDNYCAFYQGYVEQEGRTQWGCKMPGWPIMQLSFILELLPEAKVIYIDRPLEDCVVSARTINLCLDEASTQQFRQFYTFNKTHAPQKLPADRTLWLDYQQIEEAPSELIQQLEDFTGAQPIDREVLKHRIGNYPQA